MTALASLLAELAPQLVATALDVVERDPKIAARVRALLAPSEDGPAFLSRRHYAERVDLAPRTLDKLLARGLPHVGSGKLLRVDVPRADEWLAAHLGDEGVTGEAPSDEDAAIERLAVENARRGAA